MRASGYYLGGVTAKRRSHFVFGQIFLVCPEIVGPTRWEVVHHLPILPETLRRRRIARSVALILPNIPLHVVAFGCTSATIMTLGEGAV